jgi:hypothetical protein
MKMESFAARWGRQGVAGFALLGLLASAAFGGVITVSKNKDPNADPGMETSIQKAVNKAKNGDIIRIIDTEVYEEQVTIDGREISPWDGKNQGPVKEVVGGKHGITIEYRPSGSGRLFGNHARPTIKWKDTENRSPKNFSESKVEGQLPGQSGNFETNGALRILWAKDVTIDGIKVDGGGPAPFENKAVWDNKYPLFHGNAAITIAVSGGAVIRNCDITNGYFGINVKDRNTGGVFGNPNPADNDKTIPLSGFGKVGNHLFEYNKIRNNFTGMFFESSWDLASTIRYNLIYSNVHDTKVLPAMEDASNAVGGAILFKDVKYTPVAIYNNTFYNNTGNIMGGWKVGAPHLIFNNIFGKPSYAVGVTNAQPNSVQNASFEHKFPYRLHNSLFSATAEIKSEDRYINGCSKQSDNIHGQQRPGITQVRISNNIPDPPNGETEVKCKDTLTMIGQTAKTNEFKAPGGLITGTQQNQLFDASANIRWLETTKSIAGTEDLFVSTDTASADFLRPKWDHQLVEKFIKNQGWKGIGISNSDGLIADIGAVPSTGKAPPVLVRIKPSNVVIVTGTSAKASYYVTADGGQLNNAKVSFLRWVAPIPTTGTSGASDPSASAVTPVRKNDITSITPLPTGPVTINGNNTPTYTIPALPNLPANDSLGQYGFFEIVVSGKDASGNDVTSDIGFLPYRKLEYTLKIEVLDANGRVMDSVKAGEKYTLRVTPQKGSGTSAPTFMDGPLSEASYDLLSDPTAFMYTDPDAKKALTYDNQFKDPGSKTYTEVYFTHAGMETIMGSAIYNVKGSDNRLVFLGTADIKVKPGVPDHVTFVNPIPKTQLGGATPTTINRGVNFDVQVRVEDKWNNPVDVAVSVSIKSEDPNKGDVGAPSAINTKSVNTDPKTGIASFIAQVTNGQPKDEFDMTATIKNAAGTDVSDVGRLRVGRSLDRIDIFYSDTALAAGGKVQFDPTVEINGKVGEWYKVTVRVVVGDTINKGQNGKTVKVIPDNGDLVFSATEGGAAATEFSLKNGVAEFWVGAPDAKADISACIDVEAWNGGSMDGSIGVGNRCGINFSKPSSSIINAVVYGDGHGRPDSLLINFDNSAGGGGFNGSLKNQLPDKVVLKWGGVDLTATGAAISVSGDFVLRVTFTGARPGGYTSITGTGRGLVAVHGGIGGAGSVDDLFDVLDGIGPVIASAADGIAVRGNPTIVENPDPGTEPDVINITVSEQIKEFKKALEGGNSLFYIKGPDAPSNEPGASGGTALTVKEAFFIDGSNYQVVVEPIAGGLQPGDWIRFNPAGNVADAADNKSRSDNRWSQLDLQEKTPEVREAWYTSSVTTGKPDTAYVVFDKAVNLAAWFGDGSVNFGKQDVLDVSKVGLASLFTASGNTLKVDLSTAFKTSQSSIRTSEDMPFSLGYSSAKKEEWGASVSVQARDKAKPVLADTVLLYIGDIKDDGSPTTDTLRVTYSERPGDDALTLGAPVTIQTSGGPCEPALKLFGQAVPVGGSSRFYRATYLVEGDLNAQCPAFPETGNMVKIDAKAGFGDDRTPSNVQDAPDNLKQPLKVVRELKWTVRVKSNPFKSDANGSRNVTVEMSPNAKGVANVNINASIMVFDNLGALVKLDTLKNVSNKIDWVWNGTNQNGRLVGTGTYLFKAVCDAAVEGDPNKQRYSVTRSLGVVRGKS